jgi:hypothetical protein
MRASWPSAISRLVIRTKWGEGHAQILESDAPPAHLGLGSDALTLVREKAAGLLGRVRAPYLFNQRSTGEAPIVLLIRLLPAYQ